MDYIIEDNARLFDELIKILYEDDPQCHAFEALRLAKANYEQRSMDHMLSNLVLAICELLGDSVSQELREKVKSVIIAHANQKFDAMKKLTSLSDQYRASGGKLLSRDEILQEVDERRGTSR
jgi:DNA-binding response OmpR family regulator